MIHSMRANEQSRCSSQGHVRHHASELDGAHAVPLHYSKPPKAGCFPLRGVSTKLQYSTVSGIELVGRELSGAAHCLEHTWLQAGMFAHDHDGNLLHSTPL